MPQSSATSPEIALQEVTSEQRGGACTMVVFGGSGDLAKRKIFPAIFSAIRHGKIAEKFSIIGAGLPEMDDDAYRELIGNALKEFVPARHLDAGILKKFLSHLFYVGGGFDDDQLYPRPVFGRSRSRIRIPQLRR